MTRFAAERDGAGTALSPKTLMTVSWKHVAVVVAALAMGGAAPAAAQAPSDTTTRIDAPKGPWGYHGASSKQGYAPEQPIAFPHPVHVQKAKMNCQYCHFAANKSPDPGMPAVGTCMGCHTVVKAQSPEIQKLAKYWAEKKPVPWVRIHKVPDYVQFPHMRHVKSGVTCQSCHGQVQKMQRVFQYSSLNMGWCVSCHVNGYDPVKGEVASGYTKAADGAFQLAAAAPVAAPKSFLQKFFGSVVPEARAQEAAAPAPAAPAPAAAQSPALKKARYDCAVCHY
ncbi:MAG: cytochrome c3 family protein [Gemmatimonadota bacterium]